MNKLRPAVLSFIFIVVLQGAAQSAQPGIAPATASSSAEEQVLVSAIRARANAFSSGDCQGWAAFVDADFRDIEGAHTATRKEILGECQQESRPLPGHKIERLVSDFRFQFVGNIALVDYLYEFKEHFGEVVLTLTDRNVDIYEKRQGKWVALLVASATIVPDPPVAKIDSARFEDFTGEYAWVGARNVETVTRKGDQLYIQGSWEDSATELLPEKADTFFVRGEGAGPQARVAFIRNGTGRVIEERVYSPADGRGYSAKKIK
jgi:hypothetical protein